MMKSAIVRAAVVGALLATGGCGRDLISLGTAPPGLASKDDFPACLVDHKVIATADGAGAALLAELVRRPLPLDGYTAGSGYRPAEPSALSGYLDCLLGEADDGNASAQLLRGHIMLTLLAQYGAELVRASRSDRQPAQALRVVAHVREAELLLVAGARALTPPAAVAADAQLGQFWIAARIAAQLQVAIDVETVYLRRSLDLASNLVAALGGGPAALGQVGRLLRQAGAGLALTQRSQLYGTAFLADARKSLGNVKATAKQSDDAAVAREWGLWSARLDAACADLAALAKLSDPSCKPSEAAVAGLRKSMGPSDVLHDPPASLAARAAPG